MPHEHVGDRVGEGMAQMGGVVGSDAADVEADRAAHWPERLEGPVLCVVDVHAGRGGVAGHRWHRPVRGEVVAHQARSSRPSGESSVSVVPPFVPGSAVPFPSGIRGTHDERVSKALLGPQAPCSRALAAVTARMNRPTSRADPVTARGSGQAALRRRGREVRTDGPGGVSADLHGGPGSRHPYRVTPGRAGCSAGTTYVSVGRGQSFAGLSSTAHSREDEAEEGLTMAEKLRVLLKKHYHVTEETL